MAWEAADAAEALHVLAEHPAIGLVFTDVNMPGEMDGLDLAHEVHQRRPTSA
jgi:YesN/AraC family two-component response regulator